MRITTKENRIKKQTENISGLIGRYGADVLEVGKIKFVRWEHEYAGKTYFILKAFKGTAFKSCYFYRFRTLPDRAEYIEKVIKQEEISKQYKAQNRTEQNVLKAQMDDKLTVGTVLHYSWGYGQTNCEFFQIIRRTGRATLVMREIGQKSTTRDGHSDMSDYRTPDVGNFIGPEITKRVGVYGVSMDFGSASPCNPNGEFYNSWYH